MLGRGWEWISARNWRGFCVGRFGLGKGDDEGREWGESFFLGGEIWVERHSWGGRNLEG